MTGTLSYGRGRFCSDLSGCDPSLSGVLSGRKQSSLSLGKAGIDWSVCGYHPEQLSGRPGYKKEQVHPDILNAVRCLRANRKEKDDNLAVEQAYVQIPGFESQRTFNRVFRERYRMTPREYRTLYKEKYLREEQT